MRRFFSMVAAILRIALGIAAIAAIYNVLRRRAHHWDGPHGPHQA